MVNNKNNIKNLLLKNKKSFFIVVILFVISITIIVTISFSRHNNETITSLPEPIENLNFNPPTQEEKQQAIDNKQRIDENEEKIVNQPTNTDVNGKKIVNPIVTYSGQFGDKIEIGSYVPEIFEDNGVCTAILTLNTITITRQKNSVKEGRSTFCPLFEIPVSEFKDKGSWSMTIKYDSPDSSGESQERKVDIR